MEVEVEEERRRREGERGGLNLFYVWTYCAIYQWPDLSNVCLDRSVQYNIGHIWPIGQISPMEAINYNFPWVSTGSLPYIMLGHKGVHLNNQVVMTGTTWYIRLREQHLAI